MSRRRFWRDEERWREEAPSKLDDAVRQLDRVTAALRTEVDRLRALREEKDRGEGTCRPT